MVRFSDKARKMNHTSSLRERSERVAKVFTKILKYICCIFALPNVHLF
ncbi:MAG: hypothetical protein U5L45_03870 [Saprospiraceae bacterium]|nr:hypothetical protein [Saprospiraceae bacterium]